MYAIWIVAMCILAGLGTIWVGLKPSEANYTKNTKQRLVRLTWMYVIAALVLLMMFYLAR